MKKEQTVNMTEGNPIRLLIVFAIPMIPVLGLWGIWWSVGIVWFISGFTAWLRYLWKVKRLSNEETFAI